MIDMDMPTRRVITRTTVRLEVAAEQGPHGGGADYKAMMYAIHQAREELRAAGQIPDGWTDCADDAIMFVPGDDAIVLEFELPDTEHERGPAEHEVGELRAAIARSLDHIGQTGKSLDAWTPTVETLRGLVDAGETVPVPAAAVLRLVDAAQASGVGGWWSQ